MGAQAKLDNEALLGAVHLALSNWHHIGGSDNELMGTLLLVQHEREKVGDWQNPLNKRKATNIVLTRAIGRLEEQDEQGAAVLRMRFIDEQITRQVAARLHASPDQVNRWQRAAISSLTQILFSEERKVRDARYQALRASLPLAPYAHLFGLQEIREELTNQLLRAGEPYVVAITGIGGIGKTSLADAVVRRVIPALAFEKVVWLQAGKDPLGESPLNAEQLWEQLLGEMAFGLDQPLNSKATVQDRMLSMAAVLREQPALIIIDNLEQENHTQYVLSQVRKLVNPSKVLLTTRIRPTVAAPAFFRSVEELSYADAANLLRHHAQTIGSQALAAADDQDYEAIYNITGGNPLALKLVVGLAAVLPLPQILQGLMTSRPGEIETLYRHIYWEAWRTLSEDGRQLLQAMPLVAESGALPEQMKAISGLGEDVMWTAVTELFSRSLLEVQGDIRERRYSIHRLTETFLRTEIIAWPEDEVET